MKQAFLQLHLAVLLASCSGIFGNLISLDPVLITGYRMLLASVMLLLLLFIKYGRIIVGRKDSHILYNRQNQKYSFSKRKVQKIEGLETSV